MQEDQVLTLVAECWEAVLKTATYQRRPDADQTFNEGSSSNLRRQKYHSQKDSRGGQKGDVGLLEGRNRCHQVMLQD